MMKMPLSFITLHSQVCEQKVITLFTDVIRPRDIFVVMVDIWHVTEVC